MGRNALLAALAVTLVAPAAALGQAVPEPASSTAATKWVVDPVHSQVDFRIRHLVGRVRGTFTDWYGLLETQNRDWTRGTVRVTVQTRSLDTGNKYRDADLRSNRFFAVDSFPQMTFESTRIIARGSSRDREGHERIGFEAGTTIDRRDFGITWNEVVAGVSTIGDDVDITITI